MAKVGYGETGQMNTRSKDDLLPQKGLKEVAVCKECMALYLNNRWYSSEEGLPKLSTDMVRNEALCSACQRVRDNNPAGVATFTGDYLAEHEREILSTIKKVGERVSAKNPLARIMEIRQGEKVLIVFTTADKLAQKLGREIYKAHNGLLEFQWSREDNFVRVNWRR